MSAWLSLRGLISTVRLLKLRVWLQASESVEDSCDLSSRPGWDGSVSGRSQLPPEVVRGSLVQPLGIHNTQVTHVAFVGVEQ